jgi:hypothetical protein
MAIATTGCLAAFAALGDLACSSESSQNAELGTSTGGANAANGGALNGGGTMPAGGAMNASGGNTTGGTGAIGGSSGNAGTGGAPSGTGGMPGTGGDAPGTGGSSGAGGASGTGGSGATPAPLEPARGALLGLYYGAGTIPETEALMGRKVPVHLVYYAWQDDWTRGEKNDLDAGRTPLINWEPMDPTLDDIIAGVYDTMLTERANDAKALGKQFFLDWAAEMNGDWAAWNGSHYGNSAAKYVAAFKHIHDIFSSSGATNVVWAWCPNVTDEPRATWNQMMNYYPGDAYVDWACVDGYNWGDTNGGGWQSFADVFARAYGTLSAIGKPILIGEMASAESGGDKAQWIDQIVPTLTGNYPMIRGLVWFDVDKETDWRIDSSSAALAAFSRMAGDPYFNP